MAILSTMLAMSEPTGFWETIIKAFEGFTANYVLAIILLTVIIRLIWAPFDLGNRRMSQKMALTQAKMKPELDKLQKKYANDPVTLKQKQNEIYAKNNGKTMGSCLFMLLFMGLNLLVFFTLFSGLNAMSAYKINYSYENLKYEYANALNVTNTYLGETPTTEQLKKLEDYNNLSFDVKFDEQSQLKTIYLYYNDNGVQIELAKTTYRNDFSTLGFDESGNQIIVENTNQYLIKIIDRIFPEKEEDKIVIKSNVDGINQTTENLYISTVFQETAIKFVNVKYQETKDSFLWIENIWIADSPMQNSIFDFSTYKARVGKNNVQEGDDKIYNAFMPALRTNSGRVNGYLILPILCIASSFLSMWISTRKKKDQDTPVAAQGKFMKYVMPVIFGVFALFYNAVFAIYMFVSQVISAALIPLQELILDKWQKHIDKKQEKKVVVDYSRKF